MAPTYRVQLAGKQPLGVIDGVQYCVWCYELIAEAPLAFEGQLGLAFSNRLNIKDPTGYPDVDYVKRTILQPATETDSQQYVYLTVPDGGYPAGGVQICLIAPAAESSESSINLVTKNPADSGWMQLAFSTNTDGPSATTQQIRGPGVVPASGGLGAPQSILPYAAEPFGVYQPLIGWRSSLSQVRLASAMANRFKLSANMLGDHALLTAKEPVGTITSSAVVDRTGSLVGRQLASSFSDSENRIGDSEWAALAGDADRLTTITKQIVTGMQKRDAQLASRESSTRSAAASAGGRGGSTQDVSPDVSSEIAMATLLNHVGRTSPEVLTQMFVPQVAPWERVLGAVQWFAGNHPAKKAYLSPIGILHLFREYFFELGTFLGPPVGHVWLSPGGTVQLIEVNTRRTLVEQTISTETETTQKTDLSQTDQDELSDAVKVENASDTKLGATAQASGGVGSVFHASASASFNLDSSRKQAEEQTHKRMRQQSAKLSSEVRQNYKTSFRTVTETTDTSSRRYVLQNTTDRLVSYELSRKMRKVAVQVQGMGQQLCWQLYIDNPGDTLGLGEFVHATSAALDPGVKPPDLQSYPTNQDKVYSLAIPFIQYDGGGPDTDDTYDTQPGHPDRGQFVPFVGSINLIEFKHTFGCPSAPPGMMLAKISAIDFHGADVKFTIDDFRLQPNPDPVTNQFTILLTHANFNGAQSLPFDVTMTYVPTDDAKKAIDDANRAATIAYTDELALKKEQLFYDTLRARLKLIGQVRPRPQDDLREEERSIVFRSIISQLYGSASGWSNDDYHVASELIRYLFDVDAMLYFVAPDWWRPRQQALVDKNDQGELQPTIIADSAISSRVASVGKYPPIARPGHRPYYLITEETTPAPEGASLGWLIQLDGDSHRNAFLNSPWVKAVLPIRPGRERDAIAWLRRPEVAGTDGLSEPYPYDATQDPPEYKGKTMQQVLLMIADRIAEEYQQSLVPVSLDPANPNSDVTLPTESVYSTGFDPLEGGIKFGAEPFAIFTQWTEVLPTDQVVATEYNLDGL
jgi:hypothetical protein